MEIKELLRELKAMGKTIIISSHILPELADFCNKIGIIEQGELIVSGDVSEILHQVSGAHRLLIRVVPEDADSALRLLNERADIREATAEGGLISADYTGERADSHALLRDLMVAGVRVNGLSEAQTDLEDIFMRVTRGAVS